MGLGRSAARNGVFLNRKDAIVSIQKESFLVQAKAAAPLKSQA
jgi:hypothetical protein